MDELFAHPMHPYTQALLESIPWPDPERRMNMRTLEGDVPSLLDIPNRCRFCTRCPLVQPRCFEKEPELVEEGPGRKAACFFTDGLE